MKAGIRQEATGNSKKGRVVGFALCLLLVAVLASVEAQQTKKVPKMGVLLPEAPEDAVRQSMTTALLQGLRELGYVEAKNIAFEYRYGEGKSERVRDLAAELVSGKVDIIVTSGIQATRAAKNTTKTVPIVMIDVGPDPVEAGLVASLAHPGGNLTGFTNLSLGIAGKRLELLKASVPKMSLVAFLVPSDEANLLFVKEVQTAARELGLIVQTREVTNADSIESVFARLRKEHPQGLLVGGGAVLNSNLKRIVNFALNNRLPSMYWRKSATDLGGLMYYGPDPLDQYRRASIYIDKILKGTKPADLPVERPMKFDFVVNLRTAKQTGVTISPNMLIRANRVIQRPKRAKKNRRWRVTGPRHTRLPTFSYFCALAAKMRGKKILPRTRYLREIQAGGFDLSEIGTRELRNLWLRGGFPRSFLAASEALSFRWRRDFIRTFLERDVPQLGIRIPAEVLRRFWMMLAHYHAQIWNGADIARSLGVTEHTVRRYLDVLAGTYLVRQLPPWFENLSKRQYKAPKVYVRDSGILHALFGLGLWSELGTHPKLGASWEGFALEQVLTQAHGAEAYFWGTHAGAELDLLFIHRGRRYGVEFKYGDAPTMTKSLHIALADLRLERAWIVYPGTENYAVHEKVEVLSLADIPTQLPFGAGSSKTKAPVSRRRAERG